MANQLEAGCLPLGYSYAMGQAILHTEIPASPSDAGLPHDDFLLDFGEAVDGRPYDRGGWSRQDEENKRAELRGRADVRGAYAAFLRNGPLPPDVEDDSSAIANVGFATNTIEASRRVYFYAIAPDTGLSPSAVPIGLDGTAEMFVQFQGRDNTTHNWVLPTPNGQKCYQWRQSGGAPTNSPNFTNQWTSVQAGGAWLIEHQVDIIKGILAIVAAVLSLSGVGVALGAAIFAIAGALGIAAITEAVAQAMAVALINTIIDAIGYAATGDASYVGKLQADLGNLGGAIAGPLLDQLAKMVGSTVTDALRSIQGTWGEIQNQVANNPAFQQIRDDYYKLNTQTNSLMSELAGYQGNQLADQFTSDVVNLVNTVAAGRAGGGATFNNFGVWPKVTAASYDALCTVLGGVGESFVRQAQRALPSEFETLMANTPLYAKQFMMAGIVTRAVECNQTLARTLKSAPALQSALSRGILSHPVAVTNAALTATPLVDPPAMAKGKLFGGPSSGAGGALVPLAAAAAAGFWLLRGKR